MIYVALLRGVNVGGNNKVAMAELRAAFEALGFMGVVSYINSGNIIFSSPETDTHKLTKQIEQTLDKTFKLPIKVVLRDAANIAAVNKAIPKAWVNDATMKCDVMFLWQDVDNKSVLKQLIIKPEIDDVMYVPGAIVWRVNKDKVTRSGLMRVVGTPLYKQMTIRNVNTLRKLAELTQNKP